MFASSPLARLRLRAITFVVVSLGALALGAIPAYAASQPIEGTWNFEGGQVAVQVDPTGGFTGVVVAPITFAGCTHPIGQLIWGITGSGLSYTGTHVWFHSNCQPNPGGQSTWTITSMTPALYTLTFCTAHPGSGAPDPTATTGHPVGSTLCYDLTRALAPSQTPATPSSTGIPTIVGTPNAGDTLTCVPGSYTNNPTAFDYQWSRDGTPIAGATNATYTVATSDEGLTLTCTVRAVNAGGLGPAATSAGVLVPVPFVFRCPAATGTLSGQKLGLVKLGMTRAQARHAYTHSSNRGRQFEDFFCLTPIGVRVGYSSPTLLKTLPSHQSKQLKGRVIWSSTSNAFYSVHGVRPGATLTAARKVLKLAGPFHVGLNFWYLAPNGSSTAVLKVRHGIVEEVGIGNKQITQGHKAQLIFLKSFS
jgi:hypothetical protein